MQGILFLPAEIWALFVFTIVDLKFYLLTNDNSCAVQANLSVNIY